MKGNTQFICLQPGVAPEVEALWDRSPASRSTRVPGNAGVPDSRLARELPAQSDGAREIISTHILRCDRIDERDPINGLGLCLMPICITCEG